MTSGDRAGGRPPAAAGSGDRRAFAYIREKINQLLGVMGTAPLKPEELDDETLLELDPIGIISDSFSQVLEHLKETNRQLGHARDEIQAIFDSAGAGILVLDRDMHILRFNRKQAESFGLREGEAIGGNCCENMCKRGTPGKKCTFLQVVKSNGPVYQADWTCSGRVYEVFGTPLRDASGEIESVVLVYADVTEHVRVEKELRDAKDELERHNEELRQLDRLKDNIMRDVSHELKTPVAKYSMQMELLGPLIASDRLTDDEKRTFTIMQESIRRQQGMIRNLLDLARLEAGGRTYRREEFTLDALVARLVDEYREELERWAVVCTVDVPPVVMVGDEEMLWHVLSNVFNNAIKFRRREGRAAVSISAEAVGDEVVVRVTDNGIGLAPREQARIFDRFYQVSPASEGSGIGLVICRRIVEDLGGHIAIESKGLGHGATVTVRLPRKAPERT